MDKKEQHHTGKKNNFFRYLTIAILTSLFIVLIVVLVVERDRIFHKPTKQTTDTLTTREKFALNADSKKFYVGYYASWAEGADVDGVEANIAYLASYVNVVNVAFLKPDATYVAGSYDTSGVGLDFSYTGQQLKAAFQALKAKNPETILLASVGGSTYNSGWSSLNEKAIARFVADFGLDGVDFIYQPASPGCALTNGKISCPSDSEYIDYVTRLRSALSDSALLSISASVYGCFGEGPFVDDPPVGSTANGLLINLLRSSAVKYLDFVNVMAFDGGTSVSPTRAFAAYQYYYSGRLTLGVKTQLEGTGNHKLTYAEVLTDTDFVYRAGGAGMMLWHIQKTPDGTISYTNPNQQMISNAICLKFGLTNCGTPLFSTPPSTSNQ